MYTIPCTLQNIFFLATSILNRLWKLFTTLLAITRLLDFQVHYPTLPYPNLKNHYPSGPGPEQILYSVSSAADRRPVSWDGESWDAVAVFPDKGGERRSKRMETLFSTSPVMSFLMRFWGSRFCLCSYRSIELLWLTHEVLEQPGRQVVKWRAPLSAVLSVLALIVAVKHLDAVKKRILLLCRTRKYFKRYCSKHRVWHLHIWSCWCNSAVWRSSPPPAPLAKTSL